MNPEDFQQFLQSLSDQVKSMQEVIATQFRGMTFTADQSRIIATRLCQISFLGDEGLQNLYVATLPSPAVKSNDTP